MAWLSALPYCFIGLSLPSYKQQSKVPLSQKGFLDVLLTLSFRIKLVWAFIAQGIEQTNSNLNQSLKNRQGKCNLSRKPSATQLCPCFQHSRKKKSGFLETELKGNCHLEPAAIAFSFRAME